MQRYNLLGLFFFILSMFALPSIAQTPDEQIPANQGVCDELIGLTPGLYGLCVGFCEAQDCEATFDPVTEHVTFDESCKPSSPKLLQNYNKRRNEGDPPMPCINAMQNECPCWTESELDMIADGDRLIYCQANEIPARILGHDLVTGSRETAWVGYFGSRCGYRERSPDISRVLLISQDEFTACVASIAAECESRGF